MTAAHFAATSSGLLPFTLRRSQRRTLAIHVHPDGIVEVVAPQDIEDEIVEARVAARAGWIRRQQTFYEDLRPRTPKRRHVAGETHLHLGRRYRLRVADGAEAVRLSGNWIFVSAPNCDPNLVASALGRWRRHRASERISARLEKAIEQLHIPPSRAPRLLLRVMRTRWASLSRSGVLSVNPDLIRAPLHCIDYVLVHELCHLEHAHHGPAFWTLLSRRVPDWEKRKRQLEQMLA